MSFSPECRDLLKRRHSQDELHRDMTGTTDFEVHHAVQNGDIERVEALLKENPDKIGQTNLLGQTPLHLATVEGHGDIVYFLLNMGANPHAKNSLGKTPLMRAVDRNRVNIARTLLEFGADVNTRADNGSTAYTLAAKQKNTEMMDLFKPYLDSDDEDEINPDEDKKSPPKLAAFHMANDSSTKGDGAGDDFVGFNNSNNHTRGRGGHNKNRLSVEINQDDLAALIAEVQAAEVDETGGSSDEDNISSPDILGDKDDPPYSATSQASVEWETIDESSVPDRRLETEKAEKEEEFVGFQNDQSTYSAERSVPKMRRKTSLKRRSPGVFGGDGTSPTSDPPSPDMPQDSPTDEEFVGFTNPQSTYSAERANDSTTNGSVEEEMEARSKMRVRVLSVADASNPAASLGSLAGGQLPGASNSGDKMGEARSNPSRSSGVLSAEEIADILADGEEKKRDLGLGYSDSDDTPVGSPAVRMVADDLIINPVGRGEGSGKDSSSGCKADASGGYQSPSMADLSKRRSFRKSSIGADAETKSLTSILTVRTSGGDANPLGSDGEFVGFNNDGSSYAAQREKERRASQQHVNEEQWSD